jgi:hypothetical protein
MVAKPTIVLPAVLVLAGTSLAFAANASARPNEGGWSQRGDSYLQERHDPTNTNGF